MAFIIVAFSFIPITFSLKQRVDSILTTIHKLDFQNNIFPTSIVSGSDELGAISSHLNQLAIKLMESKRELEVQHAEATQLYKQLNEAQSIAKIGSWTFNIKNNFLSWSSEHYRLFEIQEPQPQESLYRIYRSKIYPDDLFKLDELIAHSFKSGEGFIFDHRVVCENNKVKYVQGIGKVIRNDIGEIVAISGTCQDMTERVMAEKHLHDNQQLLSTVLQTLPVGVFGKDIKNDFQWTIWNKQAEEIFGSKAKDCIGKYDKDFFPKEQADILRLKDIETCNVDSIIDIPEESLQTPNGTLVLHTRKIVIRDSNREPRILLGITEDITEQKNQNKKLRQAEMKVIQTAKLASLGEMSAGIAHEINNPLAIIEGSIGLLTKFINDPKKIASKIETIKKSCDRIARIVKGLRKFSRDGDKTHLVISNLCVISKEVLLLTDAKSKQHSVPVTLDCNTHASILCDEVEIEQVLVNLVNNSVDAIKSNQDKWIKVKIFEEGTFVVLTVTDSGTGIPDHIRNKLFEPFFTTKKVGEGTGLGLSITKGILDEHKATISLVSNSPNTCFELKFPITEELKSAI